MDFQGFVGPTYALKSVNVDAQRCVNLFPEIIESGDGKNGAKIYLKSTPGLTKLANVGAGPIRCVHIDSIGTLWVLSGNTMYQVVPSGFPAVWTATSMGTVATNVGTVRAKSILLGSDCQTVFVDGFNSYLGWFQSSVPTTSFGNFASYGYPQVDGATHVELIDGYFIYNKGSSNKFYTSNWNSLIVDPLSFASAEADPDKIVAIIANHRELWLFKEKSTEVWSDTGNADFPFERIQGGYFETGCLAKYSVAKMDGIVFWLGKSEQGQGIVYAATGLTPQRISTHAVESAIDSYTSATLATAFTYQSGGHSFYVLNFGQGTWVYDLTTRLWHERAFTNAGVLERHRADSHVFGQNLGVHFVGDYSSNKLYQLSDSVYLDDTDYITRMRTAPHLSADLNRVFCSKFQIDMETGIGLDGGVQGSAPAVMFDYSDDGGHTYSSESWAIADGPAGAIGQYKTRVIWRRLGAFRDRVFRIKITDPVKVTLIAAQLEIEPASS